MCAQHGRENKATTGATMQCNKPGCKQNFHVTCAQGAGLLCEEAGNYQDNVKYCGYCDYHYQRIVSLCIRKVRYFSKNSSNHIFAARDHLGQPIRSLQNSQEFDTKKAIRRIF